MRILYSILSAGVIGGYLGGTLLPGGHATLLTKGPEVAAKLPAELFNFHWVLAIWMALSAALLTFAMIKGGIFKLVLSLVLVLLASNFTLTYSAIPLDRFDNVIFGGILIIIFASAAAGSIFSPQGEART